MKNILVPTDFSENAHSALVIGSQIASRYRAALTLLHVNTSVIYAPVMSEYYTVEAYETDKYKQVAFEKLLDLRSDIEARSTQEHITMLVEEGFIHTSINRVVDELGIDMIVMGTKGASGLNEFFFGTNTERVIRTSSSPVLVIPQGVDSFNPRHVLLATTLQDDQFKAFSFLAKLQEKQDFKTSVLYLNNPAMVQTEIEASAIANGFAQKAGLKNIEFYMSGNVFDEEKAIQKFAEQNEIDCIAMVTHQRRGLVRLLFGSLTEDQVNHSHIPVLAIPIS
jgi:nucleotide-binding universal stress UspA family protein